MADTITLWNKGRRTWALKSAEGIDMSVEPDSSIIMAEAAALRMLKDYPRDWAEGGRQSGRSAAELARWEQSLKDREKNLDRREREIEAKEKQETPPVENSEAPEAPEPKRGRPATKATK